MCKIQIINVYGVGAAGRMEIPLTPFPWIYPGEREGLS